MTEYWFYHLQQSPVEQVLPDILEKTYAKGWRALVKVGPLLGEGTPELGRLDKFLWTYKKNGFLPHGRDDEPLADQQPILLTIQGADNSDGADVVVLVGGAKMDDIGQAQRCITILDGGDEQDKRIARARWKTAKDAGLKTAYWRQDDYGKWMQPNI